MAEGMNFICRLLAAVLPVQQQQAVYRYPPRNGSSRTAALSYPVTIAVVVFAAKIATFAASPAMTTRLEPEAILHTSILPGGCKISDRAARKKQTHLRTSIAESH